MSSASTSSSTSDISESKARRRAGFRLEKLYPNLALKLRQKYDTPSYRSRWGKKFYAQRTEQVRKDLMKQYPKLYDRLLREELANPRNKA